MAVVAITRDEHDAAWLRRVTSRCWDADAARPMLALTFALESASQAYAAQLRPRPASGTGRSKRSSRAENYTAAAAARPGRYAAYRNGVDQLARRGTARSTAGAGIRHQLGNGGPLPVRKIGRVAAA